MFRRLRRSRWPIFIAILLVAVAGFTAASYTGHRLGGSGSAALAKGKDDPAHRIEQLHNRTAARTTEEDPDDQPPLVSAEKAVQVAEAALQARQLPVAAAAVPAGGPGVRTVTHKQVQGKAVFAVVVGKTEVDVDRETGAVVSIQDVPR